MGSEQTDPVQIDRWILNNEGRHFEFKEAKEKFDNRKLFEYCVAIANEGGGKLLLGVTDKTPRRVIGSQAYKSAEKISDRILQKLEFRVDVENVKHPNGTVTVFHIPARPAGTAYHLEGAYFMRSNEQLVPMSEDRLREIFNESKSTWEEAFVLENLSDQDVVDVLDTQKYFEMKKRPYPSSRVSSTHSHKI